MLLTLEFWHSGTRGVGVDLNLAHAQLTVSTQPARHGDLRNFVLYCGRLLFG